MKAILLQSATSVITKCDRYIKVPQFYYKVRQVLQSAMIITKCDRTDHEERSFYCVQGDKVLIHISKSENEYNDPPFVNLLL